MFVLLQNISPGLPGTNFSCVWLVGIPSLKCVLEVVIDVLILSIDLHQPSFTPGLSLGVPHRTMERVEYTSLNPSIN